MNKLIECVPNVSEGQNTTVIEQLADILRQSDVKVLHVDSGAAANRTVFTIAGEHRVIVNAMFSFIKEATRLIDMSRHRGTHPRIGATDVCPFVPLQGSTMEDCVACARLLGKRVSQELGIPVFLYEYAASSSDRRALPLFRRGGFEGLAERMKSGQLIPDLGPDQPHPTAGGIVIGARKFLLAYNVSLSSTKREDAEWIASRLRESGMYLLPEVDRHASRSRHLPHCRAIGWYIDEYRCAQVSCNLTDFEVTGLHHVFDACSQLAAERGVEVTGSEIIGLAPEQALIDVGTHAASFGSDNAACTKEELIALATTYLKLDTIHRFTPSEKILERVLAAS